jgi:hypothetical protein
VEGGRARQRVSMYYGATLTRRIYPPTQVIRAVPYDAVRLSAYEAYKSAFKDSEGNLPVPARLSAGALAGMTSTLVTYPLDTIRFRLAVDPAMKSIPQVRRPQSVQSCSLGCVGSPPLRIPIKTALVNVGSSQTTTLVRMPQ